MLLAIVLWGHQIGGQHYYEGKDKFTPMTYLGFELRSSGGRNRVPFIINKIM